MKTVTPTPDLNQAEHLLVTRIQRYLADPSKRTWSHVNEAAQYHLAALTKERKHAAK